MKVERTVVGAYVDMFAAGYTILTNYWLSVGVFIVVSYCSCQMAYVHWELHCRALLSSPRFRALKMSTRASSGARSIGVLPSYSDKGMHMHHMPHTVQQVKKLQRRNLQTSQHSIGAVPSNAKVLKWLSSREVLVNASSWRAPYTQC